MHESLASALTVFCTTPASAPTVEAEDADDPEDDDALDALEALVAALEAMARGTRCHGRLRRKSNLLGCESKGIHGGGLTWIQYGFRRRLHGWRSSSVYLG